MTTTRPITDVRVLGPELGAVPYDHPYRVEFRRWLEQHVPAEPESHNQDELVAFRRQWQRTLHGGGWAGPSWPAAYGGRGSGPLEQFMYYEELALARAPEIANAPAVLLLGPTLMVHGPNALKARFLPGILSGDDMWCQGFSEPDAGSDLAGLRTRARIDGGEWVIDGQKIWTTWAQYADWCALLCRTEEGSQRHRGLSLLLVPVDQPGVTVRPIVQMNGAQEFCEVFFDSARAERELVVGGRGEGWTAAMTMFEYERADQGFTCHARQLVRIADVAEALRARRDAGALEPWRLEAARGRLAGLWSRGQRLRRLNLRAALDAEDGKRLGPAGSVIKLYWSELEQDLAAFAAELLGPAGLDLEHPWTEHYLGSRAASIYSGTTEIQRNIVAERLLGLPR
jgi:alkylation response protein AidB-like acyl-CoA dehydrogenase